MRCYFRFSGSVPLPYAANVKEPQDVLAALKKGGLEPTVFVINTFGTKSLLPQIDPLIGACTVSAPRIFAGQSGFMDMFPDDDPTSTVMSVNRLRPRQY